MKQETLTPLRAQIIELLQQALKESDQQLNALYNATLIATMEEAFESEKGDFVSDILKHFEQEGLDYNILMDLNFFFESVASHVVEKDQQWLLVTLPFLASSSYGLPHGRMPDSVLSAIEEQFKALLPDGYTVSVNSDILNTEYFALSPVQLNKQVKIWAHRSKPGICTFCPSFEEAEDVDNLVADIRVIAVMLGAPKNLSFSHVSVNQERMTNFKDELGHVLYKELKANYLATKIELILKHSDEMKSYLDRALLFGEQYPEVLIAPPVITLTEAGKLFRHFSFIEALKNLQQTFNLKLEELTFAIGNFYESPMMGCLVLTELRIGIGLKDQRDKILQGISWPLFMDSPQDGLSTLLNVLRVTDIQPEQVTLLDESSFMVEDEDEELMFPGLDGELHDPQPPEDQMLPVNFTLN